MLLCFISTTFWQCQKEDDLQEGRHFGPNLKRSKVNVLTGQKALEIKSLLDFEYNRGRKVAKNPSHALREYNYTIDYSKIIEVIDTLGNTNYTFKIENHPDQEPTNFFNLVLSVKTDGSTIKIVEYQMDEEFYTAYQNGEKDITDFEGTINFYTLSTTDPCPPDDTPITTEPSTGGGGSDGGGTSDPGTSDPGTSGTGSTSGGSGSGADAAQFATIAYHCNHCNREYDNLNSFQNSWCWNPIYTYTVIIKLGRSPEPVQPNPSDPCPPVDEEFGVIPDDESNPCEQLKDLFNPDKANILPRINDLQPYLSGQRSEKGFSFSKNPSGVYNYVELTPNSGDRYKIPINAGGDYFMAIHTHPSLTDALKIFSFSDIYVLYNLYYNARPANRAEVCFLLQCKDNSTPPKTKIYAIKIDNWAAFNNKVISVTGYGDEQTKRDKALKEDRRLTDLISQSANNENAFLSEYKEFGFSLYEANENKDNWIKLNYNSDGAIPLKTPCN